MLISMFLGQCLLSEQLNSTIRLWCDKRSTLCVTTTVMIYICSDFWHAAKARFSLCLNLGLGCDASTQMDVNLGAIRLELIRSVRNANSQKNQCKRPHFSTQKSHKRINLRLFSHSRLRFECSENWAWPACEKSPQIYIVVIPYPKKIRKDWY